MSQKTLAAVLLAAIAAFPLKAEGAAQEPLQVVSLLDVAELDFTPDPARMDDWAEWPASWEHDFFLVVDQSGTPTHCEPFDLSRQSELSQRLCSDLLANARARIMRGFTLGGRNGILLLSKRPFVALPGIGPEAATFVPLFSAELAPEAFTDYAPLSDAERIGAPGIIPIEPAVPPTYPRGAVADRFEGSSLVLLLISAQGDVMTCRPLETSGYARLDNASCKYALEHLRFDLSAVPEGYFPPFYISQRITYQIRD